MQYKSITAAYSVTAFLQPQELQTLGQSNFNTVQKAVLFHTASYTFLLANKATHHSPSSHGFPFPSHALSCQALGVLIQCRS